MFSKPFFMLPTRTTDGSEERDDFPGFEIKFDFLKRFSEKLLTLRSTGNRRISVKRYIEKEKWPAAEEETQINGEVVQ